MRSLVILIVEVCFHTIIFSGEPVTGLADGRPLFVRSANDKFNLANFMRTHLYASVGVLKIGNDILFNEEKSKWTELLVTEDYSEQRE